MWRLLRLQGDCAGPTSGTTHILVLGDAVSCQPAPAWVVSFYITVQGSVTAEEDLAEAMGAKLPPIITDVLQERRRGWGMR